MSIADILRQTANTYGDKPAIFYKGQAILYRKLDNEVDNLMTGLLKLGLKHQQRVRVILGNCPDFVRSYFAVTRAGTTIVPINPHLKGEELKYIIKDADIVILITNQALIPTIKNIWPQVPSLKYIISVDGETENKIIALTNLLNNTAPVQINIKSDDIAVCLYTSGTTGKPKGVLLSHGNLIFDINAGQKRVPYSHNDRHLCILPLFHAFCQMATLLHSIKTGGTIFIVERFFPEVILNIIDKHKITCLCGIPIIFSSLLQTLNQKNGYDISSLRLCISGGASLPLSILNSYEEKYGIRIVEGNGPTETAPISYVNPPDKTKPGSVGPPLEGVQVKIVGDDDNELPANAIGEICVKGANVMKGYLNQPEATKQAMRGGWFHTGDLGKVDEDGYVYIIDRKKDMLIVGGLNVYPREVEECLCMHPDILEVAVIGIHDELHGEIPMAFVVPKSPGQITEKEVILYCREYLANYKCPRKVHIVNGLPKFNTGKIDKKQLKESYNLGFLRRKQQDA